MMLLRALKLINEKMNQILSSKLFPTALMFTKDFPTVELSMGSSLLKYKQNDASTRPYVRYSRTDKYNEKFDNIKKIRDLPWA